MSSDKRWGKKGGFYRMKKYFLLSAMCGMALFLCLLGSPAKAHGADENDMTMATKDETYFTFVATEGDSLSVLVRRALQLHSGLTVAAALFCESQIAGKLGSGQLEIGQQVTIPFELLDSCALESKNLPASELQLWQSLSSKVSFDLSYINPLPSASETSPPPQPVEPAQPIQPQSAEEAMKAPEPPKKPTLPKQNSFVIQKWWYAVLAAIILLYFVFSDAIRRLSRR